MSKHPTRSQISNKSQLEEFAKQQARIAQALTQPSDPQTALSQRRSQSSILDNSIRSGNEICDGASDNDALKELIDTDEFRRAAETLIRKRISQAKSLLPLSSEILGSAFASQFRVFANNHHFNGPQAILLDGLYFSDWLLRNARNLSPACQDALRWEYACCRQIACRLNLHFPKFEGLHEQVPKGRWAFVRAGQFMRRWRISN